MARAGVPSAAAQADVLALRDGVVIGFLVLLALTLLVRLLWRLWLRRRGIVRVTYPGGRKATVHKGQTILAASQAARMVWPLRSEEHMSELQSLMRISYALLFLKKTT